MGHITLYEYVLRAVHKMLLHCDYDLFITTNGLHGIVNEPLSHDHTVRYRLCKTASRVKIPSDMNKEHSEMKSLPQSLSHYVIMA